MRTENRYSSEKKNAGSADLKAGGDSRVKNASCA